MDVIIPALDHVPLAGTLTEAHPPMRGAVLIGSAMGVPRGFYGAFADYLAEGGLTALRFDYRGIGGSLRGAVTPTRRCTPGASRTSPARSAFCANGTPAPRCSWSATARAVNSSGSCP